MPQYAIAHSGSAFAARSKQRIASSWLKPNDNARPRSNQTCASLEGVVILRWNPPMEYADRSTGAASAVGAGEAASPRNAEVRMTSRFMKHLRTEDSRGPAR